MRWLPDLRHHPLERCRRIIAWISESDILVLANARSGSVVCGVMKSRYTCALNGFPMRE